MPDLSPESAPPVHARRAPIVLIAISAVIALASALTVMTVLRGGGGASATGPSPGQRFAVGSIVPTSFGALSVDDVERLSGLGARQLAGATHGIQNYVPPDKAQVQLVVSITNLRQEVARYSPGDFSLAAQGAKPTPPTGSTIRPGTLQPNASIEAVMSFVAPRNGRRVELLYRDPYGGRVFHIDLGRVDKAPKAVLGQHVH